MGLKQHVGIKKRKKGYQPVGLRLNSDRNSVQVETLLSWTERLSEESSGRDTRLLLISCQFFITADIEYKKRLSLDLE